MSDVYKMLVNLTSSNVEDAKSDKINDSKTSNIDCEIQKVRKLHFLILIYCTEYQYLYTCRFFFCSYMIFKKELLS